MSTKRSVLITGVSRETGLGFETAKQLRDLGFQVTISARSSETAKQLAAKLDVGALQLDITDADSVARAADFIRREQSSLDVLINNAGAFFDAGKSALETDFEFVKAAFDTNLIGAWRTIQQFIPLLKESAAGRIVNVSSGAGSHSDAVFGLAVHPNKVPAYALTKLALNGLTVKIAQELKETKIKINSVCPGFVATYPGTEAWGARPVNEGAKGIVWAATLPDDGPTGGFFRDGKPLGW